MNSNGNKNLTGKERSSGKRFLFKITGMAGKEVTMGSIQKKKRMVCGMVGLVLMAFILGGCAGKDFPFYKYEGETLPEKEASSQTQAGGEEAKPRSVSSPLADFDDILIPQELEWDREGSMAVRTESFAGGTMKLSGRVEVDSLSAYFSSSMVEKGWKLVGSVQYRNVMLVFTKPNKTCTITIFEAGYSSKTDVYIYITDDIARRQGFQSPFGEETLR